MLPNELLNAVAPNDNPGGMEHQSPADDSQRRKCHNVIPGHLPNNIEHYPGRDQSHGAKDNGLVRRRSGGPELIKHHPILRAGRVCVVHMPSQDCEPAQCEACGLTFVDGVTLAADLSSLLPAAALRWTHTSCNTSQFQPEEAATDAAV